MADDITLASGGLAAAREKLFNGVLKKFQRTTSVAGDVLSTSTVNVDTTGVNIAADYDRVYLQIRPLDGDLRLADTVAHVADSALPYTYRSVKLGETWDTAYHAGAVYIRAETGTVKVEIEQVK